MNFDNDIKRHHIRHYCEGCDQIFDGTECPECGRPVAITDGFTIPKERKTRKQLLEILRIHLPEFNDIDKGME